MGSSEHFGGKPCPGEGKKNTVIFLFIFAQYAWTEKSFVRMKDGMALNAPVVKDVSEGVLEALWLEHPSCVTEVMGSIPTWNSEIFSPIAKQPSFTVSFTLDCLFLRRVRLFC